MRLTTALLFVFCAKKPPSVVCSDARRLTCDDLLYNGHRKHESEIMTHTNHSTPSPYCTRMKSYLYNLLVNGRLLEKKRAVLRFHFKVCL